MIGYTRKVDLGFGEAVKAVKKALSEKGFGVLCEIDVRKTLKEKINIDSDDYVILGACNPEYAHRVLSENKEFGLLLPCSVVVYREGGDVYVSAVAPKALAEQFGNDRIKEVAEKVEGLLREVVDSI